MAHFIEHPILVQQFVDDEWEDRARCTDYSHAERLIAGWRTEGSLGQFKITDRFQAGMR